MHDDTLARVAIEQEVQLENTWKKVLAQEFKEPYMHQLKEFLQREKQLGKIIYPRGADIFNALNTTSFDQVRVVIIGQDPYHGPNQAHGLCFSVPVGIKPPPSLLNIYKELHSDLGIDLAEHGCLLSWARQGVLLLNSVLTVEHNKPGSHQGKGWEQFTDKIIRALNDQSKPLIFVLWGSYAHNKGQYIDQTRHVVLKAAHPSPFSAYRGFFGCKHFSKINEQLISWGQSPIDWR